MVTDVGNFFFQMFGDGVIMAFFIIVFFIVLLMVLRTNIATIFIVILPLILAFTLTPKTSNMIELDPSIFVMVILGFGLLAAFFIIIAMIEK